jgi:hypothetical protein
MDRADFYTLTNQMRTDIHLSTSTMPTILLVLLPNLRLARFLRHKTGCALPFQPVKKNMDSISRSINFGA